MRSILIFIAGFCSVANAMDTGAMIVGGYGSVIIHEAGHALTLKILGAKIEAFRPYPTKVRYMQPGGESYDKWVLGLVKHEPFEGEDADRKQAWVAAMGSVTNLLSVFVLAPLLPELSSDFAKTSLDNMLLFSCFDGAAYSAADLIFKSPYNDWTKVSKLTGVSLYWYFGANLIGGIMANSYRMHWHKKTFPNDKSSSDFAVGATFLNVGF